MPDTPGTVNFPATLDSVVSLFEVANSAQTTLNGAIAGGSTSIVLTDASLFPNSGAISIDSEIVYYTSKSTNTLSGLTRGADGTTAASHLDQARVELRLIERHHSAIRDALLAAETKIGSGSSTPANGQFLVGNGTGTSTWRALLSADVTAAIGFTPLNKAGDTTTLGSKFGHGGNAPGSNNPDVFFYHSGNPTLTNGYGGAASVNKDVGFASSPEAGFSFFTQFDGGGTFKSMGYIGFKKSNAVSGDDKSEFAIYTRRSSGAAISQSLRIDGDAFMVGNTSPMNFRQILVGQYTGGVTLTESPLIRITGTATYPSPLVALTSSNANGADWRWQISGSGAATDTLRLERSYTSGVLITDSIIDFVLDGTSEWYKPVKHDSQVTFNRAAGTVGALFNNGVLMSGLNSTGGTETAFIARDTDNSTLIKYGAGGGFVKNNSGTTAMQFFASGDVRIAQKMLIGGPSTFATTSSLEMYSDVSTSPTITAYDTRAQASGVGASIELGGKYTNLGAFTSFGKIVAFKANSTDGNFDGGYQFYGRSTASGYILAMTVDQNGGVTFSGGTTFNGDLTISRAQSGGIVAVTVNNSATGASSSARFVVSSGNGTTSQRLSYVLYQSLETVQQSWIAGMFGTKDFKIQDLTAGQDRIVIDTSGQVGIGGAPETKLHVIGNSAGGAVSLAIDNAATSTLNNQAALQLITNVGGSPTGTVTGLINNISTNAGSGASDLYFSVYSGSALSERLRLVAGGDSYFSGGNLGISVVPTAGIDILKSGTSEIAIRSSAASPLLTLLTSGGTPTIATNGALRFGSVTGVTFAGFSHWAQFDTTGNLLLNGAPASARFGIVTASTYSSEITGAIRIDTTATTPDTTVFMGVDATQHAGFIQSLQSSTSFTTRPLWLQPNGGAVVIGLSSNSKGVIRTDSPTSYTTSGVMLQATASTPYIAAKLGTTNNTSSSFGVYDNGDTLRFQVTADGAVYERARSTPMGVWTSVTYASGDYTANGSMTWTVDSGDVQLFQYMLVGKTMIVYFNILASSVGGTVNTQLNIKIPGGFSASASQPFCGNVRINDNSGTVQIGQIQALSTNLIIQKLDSSNFTLSTNNTNVQGFAVFSVS